MACDEKMTTLMIRNLPRKFTTDNLIEELKLYVDPAAFDFVYVPWDRMGTNSVGYAFVNFVDAIVATSVMHAMHGMAWRTGSRCRPMKVQPAHVQGLAQNLERFIAQGDDVDPVHAPVCFINGQPASFQEVLRKPVKPELSTGTSTFTSCGGDELHESPWNSSWCSEDNEPPRPTMMPLRPPPGLEDIVPSSCLNRPPPGLEGDMQPTCRQLPGYAASCEEVGALLQQLLAAQPVRAAVRLTVWMFCSGSMALPRSRRDLPPQLASCRDRRQWLNRVSQLRLRAADRHGSDLK
eukprot:CAMPEP_0176063940 /NCGR_PEP_ID=MMETSP0120_2-20121206/31891_1 /TAXON_ID=160619 /ORGANISM="Kryptoperidinium foliaceum, Strain CCMP 1326" /LENGTH=292 /DNA_ID=CAMNT_0017397515 /DNA_START=49 /DNA_END=925 /DNA_ORIENTATION=+